jgi:tetratricopeptide (TPR) repeat protein
MAGDNREPMKLRGLRARIAALLCGLSCLRCSSTLQSPAAGGRTWYEARSEHFLIETDRGAEAANELTAQYEQIVAFFSKVAFRANRQPSGLTRVVVFANDADYIDLGPPHSMGFFSRNGGAPYDPHPTMAFIGSRGNQAILRTFCHELTHRFVAFHFPTAPVWVNEGLATYFETLRIEDNKATVGLVSTDRVHVGNPAKQTESQGWFALTSSGPRGLHWLPPSKDVRSLSAADFYARDISDPKQAETAGQMNYLGAWAQIHPLMLGPDDLQARFMRYLNALASGQKDAWEQNFDANAEKELEAQYRDLVTRASTRSGELPAPVVPASPTPARVMHPSEVHWLWASLRNWSTEPARQRARQDIEQAIQLAPERADGYLLRAALFQQENKPQERDRDIALALAHDPKDANALASKAGFLVEEQARKPVAQRNFAAVEPLIKALEPCAKSAPHWLTLARYREVQGRFDEALRYALRSAARDASCWRCYWLVGDIELWRKDIERAARALRVAVNLAGEYAPPALSKELEQTLSRSECQTAPSGC